MPVEIVGFPGFLAAYEEIIDEKEDKEDSDSDKRLPVMKLNEEILVSKYLFEGHETKPPARYTEPTLVKKLEELGMADLLPLHQLFKLFKIAGM